MNFPKLRNLPPKACTLVLIFSVLASSALLAQENPNHLIVSLISTMPSGGGYLATSEAMRRLQTAVRVSGGTLEVDPADAHPSFCSEATYLVFLEALQRLAPAQMNSSLARALAVHDQPDGSGIWGRWNANGPGTACLFRELRLGSNFTSFNDARPGDFMKIFWTDNVGRSEHGHSVIYLGQEQKGGVNMVRFWSSNKPGGFGEKVVPRSRIAYAIFSRLEYPTNIQAATALPVRNPYLAGLTARSSSLTEASAMSGAR